MTVVSILNLPSTQMETQRGLSQVARANFAHEETSPYETRLAITVLKPQGEDAYYMALARAKDGSENATVVPVQEMIEHLGLPANTPISSDLEIGPLNVPQVDAVLQMAVDISARNHFAAVARQKSAHLAKAIFSSPSASSPVPAV